MWDKPHLLRQFTSALIGVSFVLLFYGVLHYTLHLPVFTLRALQLSAAPHRVDIAQIEAVVRNEVRGNYFTVDLESVRDAFGKLPWVRKVSVRRNFPWQLEVSLEEHVALARWNSVELVNTYGEVFSARNEKVMPDVSGARQTPVDESGQQLPDFIGQLENAPEVTRMYGEFRKQLSTLSLDIEQISLSPRRAWKLRLNNGMVLELGREQSQQRLARFVAVYPYSLATLQPVKYVDLRYRNGFAAYFPDGAGAVKSDG